MTGSDESPIEYPCDFPVKAMGLATDDIEQIFLDIVRTHLPHQENFDIKHKNSSSGKYLSVTIVLRPMNREQLDAVYDALTAHEKILMRL